jgi:hypothetical protein
MDLPLRRLSRSDSESSSRLIPDQSHLYINSSARIENTSKIIVMSNKSSHSFTGKFMAHLLQIEPTILDKVPVVPGDKEVIGFFQARINNLNI